jgi:predicted GH43/DUF377 family glycosyl hydrolase
MKFSDAKEADMPDLITRYQNNPILTKDDIPYQVSTVHNAGVTKHEGIYYMLFRSHLHNGRSIIGLATSDDGFNFTAAPEPFMTGEGTYEEHGVEDPRITFLEGSFYITYSAYSRYGVRIGLAKTDDFKTLERISYISHPDARNFVLFPEKINGRYARLDRHHTDICPWAIWASYSNDLIYWGDSEIAMLPKQYHWDEMKIGPGAPPIKTEKGWLSIYHGVFPTMAGSVYRLGVAVHDLNDPAKVLAIGDNWILEPEDPWERTGYVPNVVFTCGAVPEDDGTIKLYWGGADTVMCAGTAKIDDLVDHAFASPREAL